MSSSSAHEPETFRRVIRARDPDGYLHTVIVTRRGLGRQSRVWLSLGATSRTTVVLDAATLCELRTSLDSMEPPDERI